jgi:phosphatidate cytidylyltransferase
MNREREPASPASNEGSGAMRDLAPRVLSAIVMIALALGTLWIGGHVFALFWLAAGFAVFWEWQHMVGGERMRARLIVGGCVLAVSASYAFSSGAEVAILLLIAGSFVIALLAGSARALWAGPGLVYAGALVVSLCVLRGAMFAGFLVTLWLFAVVWGTDIMAYFSGRLIGGPKLWPRVSPSKTWSGLIGGVICGASLGVLTVYYLTKQGEYELLPVFVLGIVSGLVAQGGDLFESSMKRHFGVKDSSHLIPGHGGVMDRLDGFIVAAAFAAAIMLLRGSGPMASARSLLVW